MIFLPIHSPKTYLNPFITRCFSMIVKGIKIGHQKSRVPLYKTTLAVTGHLDDKIVLNMLDKMLIWLHLVLQGDIQVCCSSQDLLIIKYFIWPCRTCKKHCMAHEYNLLHLVHQVIKEQNVMSINLWIQRGLNLLKHPSSPLLKICQAGGGRGREFEPPETASPRRFTMTSAAAMLKIFFSFLYRPFQFPTES